LIGSTAFDTSGNLSVSYRGDVIEIRVTPSSHDRFLVLNESYHPRWRAYVDTRPIDIYPTNLVMQGLVIPPDVDRVHLRFEPLSSSLAAHILMALAVMGFVGVAVGLRHIQSQRGGAP
jgi:hypothetical protein